MVRVALLLLIAGGLTIFALQNLSPIALVILGARTLALPLAAWVLGAMAAGALTTLVLSGFFSLSRSGAAERRFTNARATESAGTRSPWSSGPKRDSASRPKNTAGFSAAGSSRRASDDWETSAQDDWDDWGSGQETAQPRSASAPNASRTEVRDTTDEDWANWEGYEETGPRDRERRDSTYSSQPRRTEFESRQTPKSTQQSGSVYSYSYRDPQDTPSGRKTNEVYDAEYRVIIPPYTPTPEPSSPPPPSSSQPSSKPVTDTTADDDWDLDDLLGDLEDKPKRPT